MLAVCVDGQSSVGLCHNFQKGPFFIKDHMCSTHTGKKPFNHFCTWKFSFLLFFFLCYYFFFLAIYCANVSYLVIFCLISLFIKDHNLAERVSLLKNFPPIFIADLLKTLLFHSRICMSFA